MSRGFQLNALGVNTKLAELLGSVEAFRSINNCKEELEEIEKQIPVVAEEVPIIFICLFDCLFSAGLSPDGLL